MASRTVLADAVELSSPELILVDDALAVRAREALVVPDDTLARLEHDVWLRRLTALEAANAGATARDARGSHSPSRPLRRGHRRRTKTLAAGAVGASLMLALLLGVNVNLRGDPAGADASQVTAPPTSSQVTAPPASPPKVVRKRAGSAARETPPARSAAPSTAGRDFAWAPVAGASAYHVEFFRDNARIFAGDVTTPRLSLPATWKHADRLHRLEPGSYRWYVWPVVSGLRQAHATVQAELVVG
jgi:hypothetical protein